MVTHLVFAGRGVTVVTVVTVVVVVVVVATVLVVAFVVAVEVTGGSLGVAVGAGLARVVWISALRASATFRRSRISSICTCKSSSSPGRGGATTAGGVVTVEVGGAVVLEGGATVRGVEMFVRIEAEEVEEVVADVFGKDKIRLAKEGAGPPFSHTLPKLGFSLSVGSVRGGPSLPLATAALASDAARRARRRRVFRVSRWKWTRLKSRESMGAAVASSFGVSLFHLAAAPAVGGAGPGGGCDFSRLQLFSRSARCFFTSS